MSAFYDGLRGMAADMLAELGGAATLSRISRTYDPRSGRSVDQSVELTTNATLSSRDAHGANGVQIVQTIATLTIEPRVGDRLAIGALSFTVAEVETVAPDGEAIIYRAVLKS